jgi:hypothetical protein
MLSPESESLSSDTESEGEREEEEEAEVISSLGESWESKSQPLNPADSALALLHNKQEQMKQYHLKKHIENLEAAVQGKEDAVSKLR